MEQLEYIKIPLRGSPGKDKYALVDGDYDGEYLSQFKWYLLKNGYPARVEVEKPVKERKGYIYLHHEVLGKKPKDKVVVDHINRDKLDNRSCNLRWVSYRQSAHNRNQATKTSKNPTGVRFVERNKKNPYKAIIAQKHLGYFPTEMEAANAYKKAAKEIYGDIVEI